MPVLICLFWASWPDYYPAQKKHPATARSTQFHKSTKPQKS